MESNIMGKQIMKLRLKHGMNQPQLGDKLGVSRQTISNWENGVKAPRMGALQKMSDLFNVNIGYITDGDKDTQSFSSLDPNDFVNVPLVGATACGKPITAEQNIERYIPTLKSDLPDGDCFYLICKGNSMSPTLPNGTEALVHRQPEVEDGEMAVVSIDNEVTLKRVKHSGNQIILVPDNKDFDPILIDKDSNAEIVGKVIGMKRSF